MPTYDIIDNRDEKLVNHINTILSSTDMARFAVGYFFLSGLEAIADRLESVRELRLLIGNTSNRETIEQIAQGYRRLDLVRQTLDKEASPKRSDIIERVATAATDLRDSVELMDQTDQAERLVNILASMIEEGRLKVRIYTRGVFHAKAYIFDYGTVYDSKGRPLPREEKGIAIVGSSNLTLSGVTHNTELNVMVHGDGNHAGLVSWFEQLWDESTDFDEALMQEIRESWAVAQVSPRDIYMKTLYTLLRDRIESTADPATLLWDDKITSSLADFQKVAVQQAVRIIRKYNGVFVADVVGLGKSFIGAAIVKHFSRIEHARPLIICPAPLVDMWKRYNGLYDLNAEVVSMGYLREEQDSSTNFLLDDTLYSDRDFVLIDESHNLRNSDTQRYRVLQSFLEKGRRVCLLTATPRNKSVWDVYNQARLFHQGDATDLPVDPPHLRNYFKLIEGGKRDLPSLLSHLLIRRTRNHILRWYGFDAQTHQKVDPTQFWQYTTGQRRVYVEVGGKRQFFPKRELDTITYSIEDTYGDVYSRLRAYLGKPKRQRGKPIAPPTVPPDGELTFARYGLWHYVLKAQQGEEPYMELKRAGANLGPLIRILLFKRFESSVYAFRQTIQKLLTVHERFLEALGSGIIPAGEDAQKIIYEPNAAEESDIETLLASLRSASGKYKPEHFDMDFLVSHINHDIAILREILSMVEPITPEHDDKLQTLLKHLDRMPLREGKRLIFTEYSDTARYLYDNLNPGNDPTIEVIYSERKNKSTVVGRFAPKANPDYRFSPGEQELTTVIATDVLSEGLNLQDCDKIVNYDLHWNPVRLIQRFGRIDRIGSEHDVIFGFNFLPEIGIEKHLGLRQKLENRIKDIHETIGEDAAILDRSEQINETAMYAIYEKTGQLSFLDTEDEEEDFVDLTEAEEMLRQLRQENPEEYQRIANLRDGIRTAMSTTGRKGTYVFCQARGRDKDGFAYNALYLVDEEGNILSRDIPRVLGAIECEPGTESKPLPPGHNEAVMRVKRHFAEEVAQREADLKHRLDLNRAQKYILSQLRSIYGTTEDEDLQARVNLLQLAFSAPATERLKRRLNPLYRNGLTGEPLLKELADIYTEEKLGRVLDKADPQDQDRLIPRIICSEALL